MNGLQTRTCIISDAETSAVNALCNDVREWTALKLMHEGFDLQRHILYHYDTEEKATIFMQTHKNAKEEEHESAFF